MAILSLAALACAQPSPTVNPGHPSHRNGPPFPDSHGHAAPHLYPLPHGHAAADLYPLSHGHAATHLYPLPHGYAAGLLKTPFIRYVEVIPSPTATPRPTPTPDIPLAQRYGIPGSPVTVREFKGLPSWQSTSEKRAIVGCYANSSSAHRGEKFYTFTHDGESNRQSDYVVVTGFPEGTVGNVSLPCFEMVVWYEKNLEALVLDLHSFLSRKFYPAARCLGIRNADAGAD